jgi:RNA polymerase sigma factor (TIGR02999 family)
MLPNSSQEVSKLLLSWRQGNQEALDKLTPIIYDELRRQAHRYMRREPKGHLLQTTALINETYIRLLDSSDISWKNRAHFFALTARIMRQILVDFSRSQRRLKRGRGWKKISMDSRKIPSVGHNLDFLTLNDALNALSVEDERKGRVVEMRFFGGLSIEETAEVLGVSSQTVMRDWRLAKNWLAREMKRSVVGTP